MGRSRDRIGELVLPDRYVNGLEGFVRDLAGDSSVWSRTLRGRGDGSWLLDMSPSSGVTSSSSPLLAGFGHRVHRQLPPNPRRNYSKTVKGYIAVIFINIGFGTQIWVFIVILKVNFKQIDKAELEGFFFTYQKEPQGPFLNKESQRSVTVV